jgi:hypothetical protein
LAAWLRPKPAKPLVRFEGLPAEFSQHDWQAEVQFLNGSSRLVALQVDLDRASRSCRAGGR